MSFCPHHFILLYKYPFFFQCTPYCLLGSLILTAVEYYIVWIHQTVSIWKSVNGHLCSFQSWASRSWARHNCSYTRAFPRSLGEELMCCRVCKSWALLVIVKFSPKVIQQNFTPNFCLSNSIWEFLFLHLLTMLLVLPYTSLT